MRALLPLLGPAVQAYMGRFVDSRDSGPIYVTHFTLLLGLAGPIWLAGALQHGGAGPLPVALCALCGGADVHRGGRRGRERGGLDVGAGEAGKTLEGTAAGVAYTLLAWGLVLGPPGLLGRMSAAQLLALAGGYAVAARLAGRRGWQIGARWVGQLQLECMLYVCATCGGRRSLGSPSSEPSQRPAPLSSVFTCWRPETPVVGVLLELLLQLLELLFASAAACGYLSER